MKSTASLAIILTLCLTPESDASSQADSQQSGQQVFRISVPHRVQTRLGNNQFELHSSVPVGIHTSTMTTSGQTEVNTLVYVPGQTAFQFVTGIARPTTSTVITICPL